MRTDKLVLVNSNGTSAIAMVIVLFVLGSVLITGLNQRSLSWQKAFVYEKRYFHDANQALSSIEWATTQKWLPPTRDWQCQIDLFYKIGACIKQSSLTTGHYTMIKGESNKIKFYHLATYDTGLLRIERGHWLDYCPENGSLNCD